jgi:hypothetical protein
MTKNDAQAFKRRWRRVNEMEKKRWPKGIDSLTWVKGQEPAFAKVWDNDQDAVYDSLYAGQTCDHRDASSRAASRRSASARSCSPTFS